jgi:hypothetical protein
LIDKISELSLRRRRRRADEKNSATSAGEKIGSGAARPAQGSIEDAIANFMNKCTSDTVNSN